MDASGESQHLGRKVDTGSAWRAKEVTLCRQGCLVDAAWAALWTKKEEGAEDIGGPRLRNLIRQWRQDSSASRIEISEVPLRGLARH